MRASVLRFVLQRTRYGWLIALAAWLVILAATTILAAGAMYPDAVARGGLLRLLRTAAPSAVDITVRADVDSDAFARADHVVREHLHGALGAASGTTQASLRSGSFALPGQDPAAVRDLAVFGAEETLQDRTELTTGTWPTAGETPVGIAVSEPVAARLRLSVGQDLALASRLDPARVLEVRIVGIYRIPDPSDRRWGGDPLELRGVVEGASFRTFGPLVVAPEELLGRIEPGRVSATWRSLPELTALSPETVGQRAGAIGALPAALERALAPRRVTVETGLGALLGGAGSALLVNRAGVLLLDLQLAILAGYALILVGGLIVEHRRGEDALLRSRGASTARLASLVLIEALLLVVPAVLLGPPLALAVLYLFARAGPLGEAGVPLEPRIGDAALLLTALGGVVAVVALVLPTLLATGPLASVRRSVGRQLGRTLPQRWGLDLALVAVAFLGLWQLRQYGAPVTRSLRGTLGVDPLLIAAPALGLVAGAVLALRVVPLLARALESALTRRRGAIGALGARELARRPLRYTRSALLLMVAASIAFFAAAYSATWTGSQRDQAEYAVPADVRVTGPLRPEAATWAMAAAYRQVEGVDAVIPVVTDEFDLGASGGRGTLLAIDPAVARTGVAFRDDLASEPLSALMARMEPPRAAFVRLPDEAARFAVDVHSTLAAAPDPDYPNRVLSPAYRGLVVAVVARDATGMVHRFASAAAPLADGRVTVSLAASLPGGREVRAAAPLELAAIELQVTLPPGTRAEGELGVTGVATSASADGDDWLPLPGGIPGTWGWTRNEIDRDPGRVPDADRVPQGVRATILGPRDGAGGGAAAPTSTWFALRSPDVLPGSGRTLTALVNAPVLAATGVRLGDALQVGARFADPRRVEVAGVLHGFPTLDPARPMVVVGLGSLTLHDYSETGRTVDVDEWWLTTGAEAPSVAAHVRSAPFSARAVAIRADVVGDRLDDPIALGVIGGLMLGSLGAALFAAVGFVVSAAVTARERTGEFALLRALGISTRQLKAWLTLEVCFLLLLSLVLGIALGAVLAWVVLPSVTLTPEATVAVPPVRVAFPWDAALFLLLPGAALLVVTVLVLARILGSVGVGTVLRVADE